MSTCDILRPAPRPRHVRPRPRQVRIPAGPALAVLYALSALTACAPRQAIVESEPGRGAPAPSAGEGALTSDLERLADAQDAYEADYGYYASRTSDLGFAASSGVRVDIIQGDRNGWSAVASSGGDECAMFEGDVRAPRGYLTTPGVVSCR